MLGANACWVGMKGSMFDFFKKKPQGEVITLKIAGMHCTSCAINIDGELEELPGVFSATTKYAQAETTVEYDPKLVTIEKMRAAVQRAGYELEE
jgi:copper chaperone CopZ